MLGNTATLPSLWRAANELADGCQVRVGSSRSGVPEPGATASVGRNCSYSGSPAGASNDRPSMPPCMNSDTRIGLPAVWSAAARAIPSPSIRSVRPRRPAPYTVIRPPAAPARNRRRSIPTPAGIGIRGSHSRATGGLPASTRRMACARENPSQCPSGARGTRGSRRAVTPSSNPASSGSGFVGRSAGAGGT